jgi:uncharacterized membrane protein YkvA (DUF1232 family)
VKSLRDWARALRRETLTLCLAARHPRTPWYARVVAAAVVAYALSPIDMIPDFIPVLGQLDDLLLVPIGLALAILLMPRDVLLECRARATELTARPSSPVGAITIGLLWLIAVTAFVLVMYDMTLVN